VIHSHRLGAFGVTAALALVGGPLVAARCAPAPAAAPAVAPAAVVAAAPAPDASAVIALVNQQRAAAGLPALNANGALNAAAAAHSADQAARGAMSHTGSSGSSGGDRITAAGYAWSTWAENVAAGQPTAADVMGSWMNSAPHRANILSRAMRDIGMGAAVGANGTIYWTMDLAAP
jgi:uncharacterized protein YkwD